MFFSCVPRLAVPIGSSQFLSARNPYGVLDVPLGARLLFSCLSLSRLAFHPSLLKTRSSSRRSIIRNHLRPASSRSSCQFLSIGIPPSAGSFRLAVSISSSRLAIPLNSSRLAAVFNSYQFPSSRICFEFLWISIDPQFLSVPIGSQWHSVAWRSAVWRGVA